MFQHVNFRGNAGQSRVASPKAFEQQPRSLRDDLHLFEKQVVKLLFTWQQSHKMDVGCESFMVVGCTLRVNRTAITIRSQWETTPVCALRPPRPGTAYPAAA